MKLIVIFLISNLAWATQKSKTVQMASEEVLEVKTAIGYSTLLEFDSRPTAAVLGDQDAFKVEYLGNTLSIKPLFSSSKTNLFVFTEYDKFNFRLLSGAAANVDYSLRVKRKRSNPGTASSTPGANPDRSKDVVLESSLNLTASDKQAALTVLSVGQPPSKKALIVKFSLTLKDSEISSPEISANDITVFQGTKNIQAHNLYLSRSQLKPNSPVLGTLVIRASNFAPAIDLTLQVAIKKAAPLRVAIPTKRILEKRGKHEGP